MFNTHTIFVRCCLLVFRIPRVFLISIFLESKKQLRQLNIGLPRPPPLPAIRSTHWRTPMTPRGDGRSTGGQTHDSISGRIGYGPASDQAFVCAALPQARLQYKPQYPSRQGTQILEMSLCRDLLEPCFVQLLTSDQLGLYDPTNDKQSLTWWLLGSFCHSNHPSSSGGSRRGAGEEIATLYRLSDSRGTMQFAQPV